MEKTISTMWLTLIATEERKYAPETLLESSEKIVEYELFLNEKSLTEEIGHIILCVCKAPNNNNVCLFHYEINSDFRRKGYCSEALVAVFEAMPKESVVFADVVMVENEKSNPKASVQLLLKLGFEFLCAAGMFPLQLQYEKKL